MGCIQNIAKAWKPYSKMIKILHYFIESKILQEILTSGKLSIYKEHICS